MFARSTVYDIASSELQAVSSKLAVIAFAPDGTILRANANFLQLVGYKAREVIGHSRSILLPASGIDLQAEMKRWEAVCLGSCISSECLRVRKDGGPLWIHFQYTPITDEAGRLMEVVAFATDITESKRQASDANGQINAINASQLVIHFALDGIVTNANELFLQTMGYARKEVVGRHHDMFVDSDQLLGAKYIDFWNALIQGQHQAGVYKRVAKGGRELWFQTRYNPIFDTHGQCFKVVMYATDVTAHKMREVDLAAQIDAINKSHGIITFDINGTVLDANENYLQAMGYRLEEIEGRHHRMFVEPSFAHGPEYANFWSDLAEGRHQAGEYRRLGKDEREVWLQASYNPIHDLNGKPFKVVKYATVITRAKLRNADYQGQIASIHKAQCVISFELDGTVIDANDNFLDATGYRLSEVRGLNHRMFVDAATAVSVEYLSFWNDLARGRHKAAEFKRLRKDGREIWLRATYSPIFDMNGRPFKVVKYAIDVTEDRLRQADNEGQIAAIQKSQCVVAFDMDGHIASANENFLAALGYQRHEVEGRHHRDFVEQTYASSDEYKAFWETLRAGEFVFEKSKRIGRDGKEVWLQASYNPIFDLNGCPSKVLKIATDVTSEVALAADYIDARRQAQHDATTTLPNRVGLTHFIKAAIARPGRRIALLYLDLDHFKPINDSFGHDIGDLVLQETARRLQRAIGSDQIAARIGGDEFVVVAPDLSEEDVDELCQRLIELIQAPITHDRHMLAVGLSIGAAMFPQDATTAEDLLRCADVALYRTKGSGRGSYSFFAKEMDERLLANRNLAEEMRHGIKAGQFFLDYQPRLNAQTLKLEGVRAMPHWTHPASGRLEPVDFMAVAEKSGLVVPFGEWMLRAACHATAAWPDISVSVSVSPVQISSTDFRQIVIDVLEESGLPPQRLELEMTERMMIHDTVRARTELSALKALGVRLTLDDYGAHHTSLDSLRTFPFDYVKLDQRFIADIEGEAGGRKIVEDVIRLRRILAVPMSVQAIETTGQLLLLALDSSARVQGFHLASPKPLQVIFEQMRHPGIHEAQ